MKTQNSCCTYFRIVGDFCPDEISKLLELTPETSWSIGDFRKNGTKFDFASWTIGRCDEYDVNISNQMRKTIAPLLEKTDLLNKIRLNCDVSFYLEVVPTIYCDDIKPSISPSLDIIDFCHNTRTEIDIDYYVISKHT